MQGGSCGQKSFAGAVHDILLKQNYRSLKIYKCNFCKLLIYPFIYDIIDYVECAEMRADCRRYALKRKVAAGMAGNFRGVCPILNRANGISNTVCGYCSRSLRMRGLCSFCAHIMLRPLGKHQFFEFFYQMKHETHGNV